MEAGIGYGKTRWLEPAIAFLFFFNTFLLPQGLSFTLLLTPVWLYMLHSTGRLGVLKYALIAIALYAIVHLVLGADPFHYAVSATLLLCIIVFCTAIWPAVNDSSLDYEYLLKRLILLNFFFTLAALPLLLVAELKPLVWYVQAMSDNLRVIPRLKLFTYEASHYSYLIAPLVIFVYTKALFTFNRDLIPALVMISLPLALSLSFGVIGCLMISGVLLVLCYFRRIFNTRRKLLQLLISIIALLIIGYLLYRFFPDNIFYARFRNMLTGEDTSSRGRTYESFILAHKIVSQKSELFGIGPGQIKLFGRNIIVQYYYYSRIPEPIRIPNACAETIACFGYLGFAIRIGLQLLFFFATRVYKSPFRLWLFLFLFLFQFTGSFITNAVEYLFWLLVFTRAFDFHKSGTGQTSCTLPVTT